MEDKNIKIVEFEGTKNHYRVLSETAIMKNPETRDWQECVIYEEYKILNPSGEYVEVPETSRKVFVRERLDFLNRFSLCLDL